MLFRSFSGRTTTEAMARVREAFGPDAVILSTRDAENGGVELLVAAERVAGPEIGERDAGRRDDPAEPGAVAPIRRPLPRAGRITGWEKCGTAEALGYHGVPRALSDELVRLADSLDAEDRIAGLASALDARFRFAPIAAAPALPVMLAGPCGAGKSVTAAKLASRAALAGHAVELLTTDVVRAGAREQLDRFAELLDCPMTPIAEPDRLGGYLTGPEERVRIIDTAGINPLDATDLSDLRALRRAADVELALVLPAGGDPREAAEIAASFVRIGARRLIFTRIDASRRLGSLLAAADAGLAFAQIGITPYVARGLSALDPVSLARLLLEDPAERPAFETLHEAAE